MGTSLYVLGDTLLVGRRLGESGLSALNIAIPMINVLTGFGLLIGMGGASLMTIARAQNDNKKGNRLFTRSMILSLILGLVLLLVGLFFSQNLVNLLGSGSSNLDMANDYLSMLLLFSPFYVIFVSLTVFVRNDGGNKIAMAAMLSTSVFNLIMDWVFMYPLNMGMRGGALATGLAQVVGFLVLMIHFINKPNLKLSLIKSFKDFGAIIKSGGASFVLEISQGIVIFSFNLAFLKLAGDSMVSAYGIVANLSLLFTAILTGVSVGVQPLISEAYGRERTDMKWHYGRVAAFTALGVGLIILLLGQLMPEYLAMIFITDAPEVISNAVYGIRLYFIAFPLTGLNLVFTVYLQSQKKTLQAFILSLQRGLIWIIIFLLFYSNVIGITGVWLVKISAELLTLIIGVILFLPQKNDMKKYEIINKKRKKLKSNWI